MPKSRHARISASQTPTPSRARAPIRPRRKHCAAYSSQCEGRNLMVVATRTLTMAQAIAEAIGQEMERDERVFVLGEDIGTYGGIFGATGGLLQRFGPDRVMDTPISETAFIGAAMGAAAE